MTLFPATSTTLTNVYNSGGTTAMSGANALQNHRLFFRNQTTAALVGTNQGFPITSSSSGGAGSITIGYADTGAGTVTADRVEVMAFNLAGGSNGNFADQRPLFMLSNEDATRRVAVYADTVSNTIKARYWDGSTWSSFATCSGFYFQAGDPIFVGLAYASGTLTLTASCGGVPFVTATLSATISDTFTRMVAGDGNAAAPIEWWGGWADTSAYSTNALQTFLREGLQPVNPVAPFSSNNEEVREFAV
jgi:hypothetical protein